MLFPHIKESRFTTVHSGWKKKSYTQEQRKRCNIAFNLRHKTVLWCVAVCAYSSYATASTQNIQSAAQKQAILRTGFFFPGNIRSMLEECLSKCGGHLEDVMFI